MQTRPVYQFDQSFEYNAKHGPVLDEAFPPVPDVPRKRFFGMDVNSRYGIAAGPGINAQWLRFYGALGFDILTYKTVRLVERLAHPSPNFAYSLPNDPADPASVHIAVDRTDLSPELAHTVGSMGTPSSHPDFWQVDIQSARASLRPGQVLIVSIMGTAAPGLDRAGFVREFETLAGMAREAGAQMIEANLSCPNVVEAEGQTYMDAALSGEIAQAVMRGARGLPALLKIGHLADDGLASFLRSVAGKAQGITLINGPSRRIVDEQGRPFFGATRQTAGVTGAGVHAMALDCIRRATALVQREHLDLQLVGVGGASTPDRAAALIEAGAQAALVASSALIAPYSALILKRQRPDI